LHTPLGDVSWAQILGVIVVIVVGKMLAARKGKTAHEATG